MIAYHCPPQRPTRTQRAPEILQPTMKGQTLPQEDRPQRPTRTRRAPEILQPTMKGQTHSSSRQQHLHVSEEQAIEYDDDIAQYAAMLLQSLQEGVKVKSKKPSRKANLLVNYSLGQGIKKFRHRGFDAAKGEMKQLHDRSCWKPISVQTLTPTERKKALESLIFLVEKKCGKIKVHHCANGSKQRKWMRPKEAASPTVVTESVLLTATVEANERRDIATFDITNAFIQTEVDEVDADGDRIIMKIRGAMVDMLL